jgi:hypothetical protein
VEDSVFHWPSISVTVDAGEHAVQPHRSIDEKPGHPLGRTTRGSLQETARRTRHHTPIIEADLKFVSRAIDGDVEPVALTVELDNGLDNQDVIR